MVRYLIFMSYIGTRYRGAAKQINNNRLLDLDSIQGALEAALRSAFYPTSKIPPIVAISSRTDAGVHAFCNTAQVELEHPQGLIYDANYITAKLNLWFARCGHEIRIVSIRPITQEFNARFSAKSRTYFYRFAIAKDCNEHQMPIVELGRSWRVSYRSGDIDVEALRQATKLFMGRKNFSSFSPKNKTNRNIDYVKELMELTVEPAMPLMLEDPRSEMFNFWHITVRSKSFVYNQVRRIVGALMGLASGCINEKDITTMLQVPSYLNWDNRLSIAPPCGLYLKNVEYDDEELARCTIKQEKIELNEK
ncbi:hypothetical protein PV325_004946 [Microctonus aethiopoides]|uniref:tRNA pseudouridine synthase n=2 Tax=Braconidae TaxID=7402 RepID=A0AA39KSC7_9HYME|nr:hypothetical protein PV325_004946 [Microctonus aethiopoides]KAK0095901.1 hypothetical protein PV326_007092 [Microctonus aethiopoides]KAK0171954.1 hypothetical protein PV328_005340 [Microctonus aethiopoides]